ncbi:MAG: HAD family hydrolase [Actinomycetota bacterium]|nr:HAD family hydrolase [Actinomycetota bacterium]MDP2287491.1 HAD family hydrolase [Actinomycetota bacterium]
MSLSQSPPLVHFDPTALESIEFPQLIGIDVDGTLVPADGVVRNRVIQAIADCESAGVRVVLATGRSLSTTTPIARAARMDGWMVCSNGSILATATPEAIIEARTFDPAPFLDRMIPLLPGAIFTVEDAWGVMNTNVAFRGGPLGMAVREMPLEDIREIAAVRLVIRSEEHMEEGLGHLVAELDLHEVQFGIAKVAWLDVGPLEVSKASMLESLCRRLDLDPARTITIGDGGNDLRMLEWAGLGVAMGSASDEVKSYANAVTNAEASDGVAEVLEAVVAAKR